MPKNGIITGPSHKKGGIEIKVIQTGEQKWVEGGEYVICKKAIESNIIYSFMVKTNKQILDEIHKDFNCPEFENDLNANDFIICKLSANDKTLRSVKGTVMEILNEIQSKNGCTINNRSNVQNDELKKGGLVSSSDAEIIENYPKLTPKEALNNYNAVMALNLNDKLTDTTKTLLEKYEGRGNQYEAGKIDEGLVHQFYTPYIIVKKMWDLAIHYGFKDGNVLEPSCGTGRFFKFAPTNTNLFGFDLDETNIKIATALYPEAKLYKQEFETAFLQPPNYSKVIKNSWLPPMDLVIGNPPYGDYEGYFKTYMPKLYSRFEFLFIRKGLELLKPGGLLIYIISQNLMNNGGRYDKMKQDILNIATFVDAVRLPVGIFTGTQIGTDIVIFRKK